jgi:RNA polymerase sigma factor (sigma-70 family)
MTLSTRAQLKQVLVTRYAALRRKLEAVAGSKDSASDVLQETWIRIETMTEVGPVANPDAYVMRMATNVAIDQHRREQRHLHEEEVEEAFEMPDELGDPERILAGRRQVEVLEEILRSMPPRRKAILLAARLDGKLNREIAEEFDLSLRMIERELHLAMKHCNERLWRLHANEERAARPTPTP